MLGSCFRELYLGKSNTLNYYMPLFEPTTTMLRYATALRSNATQAFKALITTTERVHREDKHARRPNMRPWPGYDDPAMEALRVGVGPEGMAAGALEVLRPSAAKAEDLGDMPASGVRELERNWKKSTRTTAKMLQQGRQAGGEAAAAAELPPHLERPRPVVTYMWRDGFK